MTLLLGPRRSLFGGRIPTVNFDPASVTFTHRMAKRTAPGPFAAAPIVQGKWSSAGTPDNVLFGYGSQISNSFYANYDAYQGSLVCWFTPEWAGSDSKLHYIFNNVTSNGLAVYKHTDNKIYIEIGGQSVGVDASGWTAGTTYFLVFRWDTNNTLDGTNYLCVSINDAHTFGATGAPTVVAPAATLYVGHTGSGYAADGIEEGLTNYRRCLYDGTNGVDAGNGDEINLIHASGAGKKPEEVTGGEDIVFGLPTNGTAEELATGTGEAWSFSWSDNELIDWHLQRMYGGEPWAVVFNATTTNINCGSGATLDDLHDGIMTVEAWIRADGWGEGLSNSGRIFSKSVSGAGWLLTSYNLDGLTAFVYCANTNAISRIGTDDFTPDSKWHHVTMYFQDPNDAGDGKIYIAVDGVWVTSYDTQDAGVGAIVSDAGDDLYIGNQSANDRTFDGAIGWCRISDNDRYDAATPTNFTPPRLMPAADGNTIEQWALDEGTGATITAVVTTPGNDGTLANGNWERQWLMINAPTLADAATADILFDTRSQKISVDAALEGIRGDTTPAAGEDKSVWAWVKTGGAAKGVDLRIYDLDNTADIVEMTTDATAWTLFNTCYEVPAGCSNVQHFIESTDADTYDMHVAQVQVLPNLFDDPGMETGTAITGVGSPTTSEQSADQAHSGTNSWKIVADATDEGFKRAPTTTSGKYYLVSGWVYAATAGTVDMIAGGTTVTSSGNDAWKFLSMVILADAASEDVTFQSNAAQTFYVDDVSVITLTDISLTVTPASEANSTENGGLRVDGLDEAAITNVTLKETSGKWRYKITPRHDTADIAKFGLATPIIAKAAGSATYITVDWSAANTMRLTFDDGGGAHNSTWDATGAISAGTAYLIEVEYNAAKMTLSVDGVVKITITTAIIFTGDVPDAFNYGSDTTPASHSDMVFSAP